MSVRRAVVRGVHTAPNGLSRVPDGSLRSGVNIVFDRDGVAQSRPGFYLSPNTDATVFARRLIPWNGSILRVNTASTSWIGAPTTGVTDGTSALSWTARRQRAASASKNLYLNTDDGVRKLTSTSDVVASLAGIDASPTCAVNPAAGSWLANNSYAAYRAVLVRRDANNNIIRSAAVGSALYRNTSGGAAATSVVVYLPLDATEDDVIELYRTRSTTVVPGNEFYLVASYELAAADITALYCTIADARADGDLGAALYTNDSSEGIEGANFRGPMCKEIATFNGSLFMADTLGPYRFVLKWNEGGDCSGSATGIGYRTITGDVTNGNPQILLASSTTGLQVGQLHEVAGGQFGAQDGQITGISGTTITMSGNWTGATAAGVTLVFHDAIHLDPSSGFTDYYPVSSALNLITSLNAGSNAIGPILNSTVFHGYAPGLYQSRNSTVFSNIQQVRVVVEERKRNGAVASIVAMHATHGDEFFPPLPLPGAADDPNDVMRADDFANGLYWSKTDEPEHVPLSYYERVGDDEAAILRLAPTRDALWIFKEDGLWRLSGVSADSGWRIDPFDPTLRLLAPDALTVLDDVVYAWTNRGPVMVTDSGVVAMGGDGRTCPISDQLDVCAKALLSGTTGYAYWMAADPVGGNVFLALNNPSSDESSSSTLIWCFNVETLQWSRWYFPQTVSSGEQSIVHMTYEETRGLVYTAFLDDGSPTGGDIGVQRSGETAAFTGCPRIYADYVYTPTVSAVDADASTITINGGSGWTIELGDVVILSNGTVAIVTNPGAATATVVAASAGALATGAATAYKAITAELEWNAMGDAVTRSRFIEALYSFEQSAGLYLLETSFSGQRGATATRTRRLSEYNAPTFSPDVAETLRSHVPPEAARGTVLHPAIEIAGALSPWRLGGIAVVSESLSTRVGR